MLRKPNDHYCHWAFEGKWVGHLNPGLLQAMGTEFWHQRVTPKLLIYKTYKIISQKLTA
jgi:hypothetical protein